MKKLIHLILATFCLVFVNQTFAQETSRFDSDFEAIDQELQSWDPVRGKWLGNSMRAMSSGQPIPDRTFPEDFSPGEMMRLVPESNMSNIRIITQANSQNSTDLLGRQRWNRMNSYVSRPNCNLVMGRTYGDPHLKSFDGESYSFQTVGEFVLASSNNGQMEVQVRQEPQRDDFSLNTAVAMQVGGDRIGIYANGRRNTNFNSPVLLNGFPLQVSTRTYYLPHGGTIRHSGKNYTVTWPTGEKVSVDMRRSGSMNFMNVAVQMYPCASNNISGLLGNANGSRRDDYNIRGGAITGIFGGSSNNNMEKERQAFLAKDFANYFRITPTTTLFDYEFGQNTMSFTDYSYPRVYRSISNMPVGARTTARTNCERAGLTGAELRACMYDNGYLNIPPTPRPVIEDRTTNCTLGRIDRPQPNVNPPRERPAPVQGQNGTVPTTRPITQPRVDKVEKGTTSTVRPTWTSSGPRDTPTQKPPTERELNNQKQENSNGAIPRPTSTNNPNTKVEKGTTSRPTSTPAPRATPRPVTRPKPTPKPRYEAPKHTPKPKPVYRAPAPKPRPVSKPKPRPTPKPKSKPAPRQSKPSAPAPSRGSVRGGRG